MVRSRLRAFFLGAFADKYHTAALTTLNTVIQTLKYDKARLRPTNLPMTDLNDQPFKMPVLAVMSRKLIEDHPDLLIMFTTRDQLDRTGMAAVVMPLYTQLFKVFRYGTRYRLVIGLPIPSVDGKINPAEVVKELTTKRTRNLFVHEFTHYMQDNAWFRRYFTQDYESAYQTQWQEHEAWLTESLERFLSNTSKAILKKLAARFDHFKIYFEHYLASSNRPMVYHSWVSLPERKQRAFMVDAFAILHRRLQPKQ